MSLAKLKKKENSGKKAHLPKLKTLLATPFKNKCPVLGDVELDKLQNILLRAISSSGKTPRAFATDVHMNVGLQSSLRAINNCKAAFVLLSLSIKPHHLISLIARNAENKDETLPVYVQPKLELFAEEVFGVRSLALVFPKDLEAFGDELIEWIKTKVKPKQIKPAVPTCLNASKRKKMIKIVQKVEPHKLMTPKKIEIKNETSWSGDFISFSNSASSSFEINKLKLDEEKNLLDGALSKMKRKVNEVIKTDTVDLKKKLDEVHTTDLSTAEINNPNSDMNLSDSEDFLGEYRPLIVHKINPKPNKKLKKKRKSKTNKKP